MDAVARKCAEPWEVRMDNPVPAAAMPYVNVANKHFDSGDFPASLRRAVEMIGLAAARDRQARGEPDGRRIGFERQPTRSSPRTARLGVCQLGLAGHRCLRLDQAVVRLTADGGLVIRVGVPSAWTGHGDQLRADRPR